MKKEIVFIDEETLTKDEMQMVEMKENTARRMKRYYDLMGAKYGETKE